MADTVEQISHLTDEQDALDALQKDVLSPEDQKYLDDEQAKIKQGHAELLGKTATTLVETRDGTLASEDEVKKMHEAGQDMNGQYKNGQR